MRDEEHMLSPTPPIRFSCVVSLYSLCDSQWTETRKTRMISNFTADRLSFPWFDIIYKKKKKWWISLFYVCLQWDLMHSAHLIFWNTGSVQQQANHNWARQEG